MGSSLTSGGKEALLTALTYSAAESHQAVCMRPVFRCLRAEGGTHRPCEECNDQTGARQIEKAIDPSAWKVNSRNFALKLSEKSRRQPKRGPKRHPNRPVLPVLTPIHVPNSRPERHPNPFSDSFLRGFSEVATTHQQWHHVRGGKG